MSSYRIVQKIGSGGFGVVFLAVDEESGREVALKMLVAQETRESEHIDRFHREIRAAAQLSHPHLVKVFDSGEINGRLFLAMELVRGEDLSSRIASGEPAPLAEALELVRQAADALAYLHGRGFVHRDIKPGNLRVDDSGSVKVMDLGLVRPPGSPALTAAAQVMGTPRYMSPEALEGGEHSDRPERDVWALAVSLHEMLLADRWFHGPMPRFLAAIVQGATPLTESVCPEAPAWLVDLQARAFAREPAARPSAAAYRDALAEGLARMRRTAASARQIDVAPPVQARLSGLTRPVVSRATGFAPPPRRLTRAAIGAGVVAVLAGALAGALAVRPRQDLWFEATAVPRTALSLESQQRPGVIVVRLSGPAAPGGRVELREGREVRATAPLDAAGVACLESPAVPASRELVALAADGRPVAAPLVLDGQSLPVPGR